ncbi:MAG: alpha/beta hydrolase [Cyanobacteria bacterium CRU_2_1]|nr:alpha/beta hydrolase [Cyanobacteria bacterium RU_5_0]NJR60501.1 alpha/beta hydrolase [Cyanobacteria bacterium CRU_2_1]
MRIALGLGLLPVVLNAGSALGAERITLTYGALERSISVESLEIYARDGEIPRDLRAYIRLLDKDQLQEMRQLLTAKADLSPIVISQFLYTEQGEALLRRLGEVVRTESNLSGFYAIRSALILAASEPEGLTVLNVLQEFPLDNVRIDISLALQLVGELEDLIQQTQDAIALVEEQSALEASAGTSIDLSRLADLRPPGSYHWQKHSISLNDLRRNRSFPVDLYLPETQTGEPIRSAPVIVISHGLGSDRSTYAYLAQHLASYGFAVAVPEHLDSNAQQLQSLLSGVAREVTPPVEFINRPLDVKYLLNELDYLSHSDPDFRGRLNVQQVGVIGQSMGGYTALALAGANINFEQLAADCTEDTLNLSLLLQCRALELPQAIPDFRDDRVKAVIAINPIGSSLLGQADYAAIQIPVMIVSGGADTVAPALLEQIRPFTWLQTPDKYLLLLKNGTHFSTIDVPNPTAATDGEIVQLPAELVGPDPRLAHTYLKSMSLAFFTGYIANQTEYLAYLDAAYVNQISNAALPARLVRSLTPTQLAKITGEELSNSTPSRNADSRLRNYQD